MWGKTLFRGLHKHTVDEKGRLSIPAKFREALDTVFEGPLFVTGMGTTYLVAYPANEWRVLEAKLMAGPELNVKLRRFRRLFYAPAQECPVDKAGRILLPPVLRVRAELERDIILAGMGKTFEIWDATRYEEMVLKEADNLEELFSDVEALEL